MGHLWETVFPALGAGAGRDQSRLKRNICGLDDYAVLSEVHDLSDHQKEHIGDALEYACHFWTKHLLKIPSSSPDIEEVWQAIHEFSTTHLLPWIEVLSLIGKLDVCVYALNDVQQWYTLVSCLWIIYGKPIFTFD